MADPGPSPKRGFPDSKNTIMHSSLTPGTLTQVMHETPPLPPLPGPISPVFEWIKRNGG